MGSPRFRFGREECIHLDKEVERVLRLGHRVSHGSWNMTWAESDKTRFAIRISGLKEAVSRNRMKRLIREVCRQKKGYLRSNIESVITYFSPSRKGVVPFREVLENLMQLFQKSKILDLSPTHE